MWTVGHSNRPIEEFLALLQGHGIHRLLDVRTVPRSRHNPQFNLDTLPETLAQHGISHLHLPGLGGLRRPRPDSINTAWRNQSFRGYADYMQTAEFQQNLNRLMDLAHTERVAIMCAEAVPWRCHRSLIADALSVRGFQVQHIMTPTRSDPHRLTPFAAVDGLNLTYPGLGAF